MSDECFEINQKHVCSFIKQKLYRKAIIVIYCQDCDFPNCVINLNHSFLAGRFGEHQTDYLSGRQIIVSLTVRWKAIKLPNSSCRHLRTVLLAVIFGTAGRERPKVFTVVSTATIIWKLYKTSLSRLSLSL